VENKSSNGPLRVQSKVGTKVWLSILQRETRVKRQGYAGIPQRARQKAVKQGGTADNEFIRPWQRDFFCQGLFL
jgi:hypothetical protein